MMVMEIIMMMMMMMMMMMVMVIIIIMTICFENCFEIAAPAETPLLTMRMFKMSLIEPMWQSNLA